MPADPVISMGSAALLIIDFHNTYLKAIRTREEQSRWKWFYQLINPTVLPNTTKLFAHSRLNQIPMMYAKIDFIEENIGNRSHSHRKPGFNKLFLPQE